MFAFKICRNFIYRYVGKDLLHSYKYKTAYKNTEDDMECKACFVAIKINRHSKQVSQQTAGGCRGARGLPYRKDGGGDLSYLLGVKSRFGTS